MAATARQQFLDFGPVEHFNLLHGAHQFAVTVALKAASGDWNVKTSPHALARDAVTLAAGFADYNAYLSQAGFAGIRSNEQARALPCCFVDLDYYKRPDLARLTPAQLLDRTLAALPWLPVPTLLFSSGRGAYFVWVFDNPLARSQLHAWQAVEDELVAALVPFGADASVRDAARVLRIAGSRHLGAGSQVTATQTGPTIPFMRLQQAAQRATPVQPVLIATQPNVSPALKPKAPQTFGARKSAYRLAQTRMADYRTLARLRGAPLRDYRARLLYAYAQAAAWFCGSLEQLERELTVFAEQHFSDARNYSPKRVKTVLQRFTDDGCGKVARLKPERGQGRYRFTNRYIVGLLDITAEEMRHLSTVIDASEKARRRREREGRETRTDYRSRGQEKRADALRMRQAGISVAAIARELGITRDAVYKRLRGHHV